MNRWHLYIIAIVISAFAILVSAVGNYTFTFVELIFFASSIMMVFSLEKLPTENLEKPQIHKYVNDRLNVYNALGAANIIVFIILYIVLKFVDPTRGILYLFASWIGAAIIFREIYKRSTLHRFKNDLINYLISQTTSEPQLNHVTGNQVILFVDLVAVNSQKDKESMLNDIASKVKLTTGETTLLYSLSEQYSDLNVEPLKSAELP